ncbi:hypothetical protein NG798_13425 [Ancylothrix sp. C2]|uniref:hypothetical protein n=1 Tax=Ancylothrix sp. D3o TaxID=2953691 RepID=UPI0021BA93C8|nr:hypothetical protein [Ancylothrix sp. D3o]MCT7950796.1 hypothetical protein [Ancylothrix sp. D3o]
MIKHDSALSVISRFNPVVSLDPQVRQIVNEEFIYPILKDFFIDKGGIDYYEELDPDKIKTEIEFSQKDTQESYVKSYVYKEVMNVISKNDDGTINFKPRYVVSFDQDLTDFKEERGVKYGELRLGDAPILYFIYLDLQEVIQFIKNIPQLNQTETKTLKVSETAEERRNKLIDELVGAKHRAYITAPQNQKDKIKTELDRLVSLSQQKLQGNAGKFRVNLSWNTTDDLDLQISTEGGRIDYQNKTVEYQGIIGKLDIDANANENSVSNPQENVTWEQIPKGKHTVLVNFYKDREKKEKVAFTVFIDNGDDSRIYNSFVQFTGNNKTRRVVQFEFVNGEMHLTELL